MFYSCTHLLQLATLHTQEYEPPAGALEQAIEAEFGALEALQKQFNAKAAGVQVSSAYQSIRLWRAGERARRMRSWLCREPFRGPSEARHRAPTIMAWLVRLPSVAAAARRALAGAGWPSTRRSKTW